MTKKHIGQYLASVRKSKKLTQEQAGELANMSNSIINAIDNGKGAYTMNSFIAYCGALDIHLEMSEKSTTNNITTMVGTPPPSDN